MPDIFFVISRRWKWMLTITLLATACALLASLLSPKMFLGTVTAVPSNSIISDKARIFNQNIEALYGELGTPDELDKIEGTARLDTLFLAAAKEFNLMNHYGIEDSEAGALHKAAALLQKHTEIKRTGFGELQIKVWNRSKNMAATLANSLLQKLNDLHQQLRTENSRIVLQRLKEELSRQQAPLTAEATDNSTAPSKGAALPLTTAGTRAHYAQLINEYELALKTAPKPLLVVEPARPAPKADKPNVLQTVALAFAASLLFSFLFALYTESRRKHV